MGLFFGRYGIRIVFSDGEEGFFMGTDRRFSNLIFVTNDWDCANK